jgi:Flp pilus assembly protein TadD
MILRKDVDHAQTLLENGSRQFPDDGRFVFNLARLNYEKKQYAISEKYAREAARLDPISADSYILLGQILLKQGKAPEATQLFRHGVELNPYDETYHTTYGIVLKMNGDCAGANAEFDQALALNPNDAIARSQILACQASLDPTNHSATK